MLKHNKNKLWLFGLIIFILISLLSFFTKETGLFSQMPPSFVQDLFTVQQSDIKNPELNNAE